MPEVSLAEWEHFLEQHQDAHLLQTGKWGELKRAFGWEPVRIVRDGTGLQALVRRLPFGLSIVYAPKVATAGPHSAVGEPLAARSPLWEEFVRVCRARNAVFCKVEPDAWDKDKPTPNWSEGQRPGRSIQPIRTILVSLDGADEIILARMKQKTRYNIKLAERKGVAVRPWDDIGAFHAMMRATGARDGFAVHSAAYYDRAYSLFRASNECELLVAEVGGKPVAALMVFAHGRRAWYFYGASTEDERNRMPTYLLQWEAMRWAKRRGCETYDLWGVPDADEATLEAQFETRTDGLWGVYRFKRGFGGQLRRCAAPYDIVFRPGAYALYSVFFASRDAG